MSLGNKFLIVIIKVIMTVDDEQMKINFIGKIIIKLTMLMNG